MGVANTSYGTRNTAWEYLASGLLLTQAGPVQQILDCQDVFSNAVAQFKYPSAPATVSVNLEGSLDGVTWTVLATSTSTSTNTVTSTTTTFRLLRVNVTAFTGGTNPSITAIVGAQPGVAGSGGGGGVVTQPTASNLNALVAQGAAASASAPWPVELTDGTNGVVAVKAASTAAVATDKAVVVAVSPNNTVNVAGTGTAGTPGTAVLTVQGVASGTAQPVSGTVTAAQATAANLLATATQGPANTAANAWPTKVTDGTNVSAVKAASTAAVATDPSLVVAVSPNTALPTGANTLGSVKVTDGTTVATVNSLSAGLNVTYRDTFGTAINATQLASLPVAPGLPNTANILANSATTTGSTIITIPINRVWYGTITLSCTQVAASLNSAPTVTIQSAGTSFPASGTVLAITNASTGATTSGDSNTVTVGPFYVAAPTATNTATLQLNAGALTAPTAMSATANGILL